VGVLVELLRVRTRNNAGLRIAFGYDTVDDVVLADFELDDRFSGAPSFVHGGSAWLWLDEAMAWTAIAVAGRSFPHPRPRAGERRRPHTAVSRRHPQYRDRRLGAAPVTARR